MKQDVSRSATLFAICIAHFLMPFMMSAVGVALPAMGREFSASAMQLGLVETFYVMAAAIFLLSMGRLGDLYGRRRIFLYGVILFTIMGAVISQAWSIESLIALRFLQGMGGAMAMATSMAIVVSVFPENERGKALGLTVASVYSGISCGPFIGGAIVSALGWRHLFYLCFVMGVITAVITRLKLKGEWADAKGEPFDFLGSLIYAVSIVLLVAGASNLDRGLWAVCLAFSGVAGFGVFIAVETKTMYPLLDIRLLRHNRIFAFSSLSALLNYAATFGVTFFLSLFLQYVKGMTPREAGMILMVQPVVQAVLSPFCGRFSDTYPAEKVATAGMALCSIGLFIAAFISEKAPVAHVIILLVFLGTGFALFSSPNTSVIMGSVEKRHLGVASGLVGTMRTLGMMTSMTIITIIFSLFMGSHAITLETRTAFMDSMRTALFIFCILCFIGILCSFGRFKKS